MDTRYEEALERARAGVPIDEVFPELKESEDERIRKNCIHFLGLQKAHHADTSEIDECISYLEKQKEQKPAEWSEEDEKCIKDIVNCLEYLEKEDTERQYNGDRNVNPKRYIDMIAKLKSLRPQPHWKPSKEQMDALKLAYEDAFECPESGVPHMPLKSLLSDLQKLL